MRNYFPADFVNRPKQGFNLPLAIWFKEDLIGYARSRLLRRAAVVPYVVQRDSVERLLIEHERLERDWSGAIWALLIFEVWCARRQLGPEILGNTRPEEAMASASTSGGLVG